MCSIAVTRRPRRGSSRRIETSSKTRSAIDSRARMRATARPSPRYVCGLRAMTEYCIAALAIRQNRVDAMQLAVLTEQTLAVQVSSGQIPDAHGGFASRESPLQPGSLDPITLF